MTCYVSYKVPLQIESFVAYTARVPAKQPREHLLTGACHTILMPLLLRDRVGYDCRCSASCLCTHQESGRKHSYVSVLLQLSAVVTRRLNISLTPETQNNFLRMILLVAHTYNISLCNTPSVSHNGEIWPSSMYPRLIQHP